MPSPTSVSWNIGIMRVCHEVQLDALHKLKICSSRREGKPFCLTTRRQMMKEAYLLFQINFSVIILKSTLNIPNEMIFDLKLETESS